MDATREALRELGLDNGGAQKPLHAILDILGDRLLSDPRTGAALRELLLRALPMTKWTKLRDLYRTLDGKRMKTLHGKATQAGIGSAILARYWHQGGTWARAFVSICDLPAVLAERRAGVLPEDQEIESVVPLPPLHEYQQEIYGRVQELLRGERGSTAILSLPTGAGKTRVAVEAILDHLAKQGWGGRRDVVLWIAHSEELLRQAWECFRQVWQTPPQRSDELVIPRHGALRLRRAWGSIEAGQLRLDSGATVLLAGIQQLRSWVQAGEPLGELWPSQRMACVVLDEAHRVITHEYGIVLNELGLCKQHRWEPLQTAPPVLGLTATPWRTGDGESEALNRYFSGELLTPESLGTRPISTLQRRGILSRAVKEKIFGGRAPEMTPSQQKRFMEFHEVPNDYLEVLGRHPTRNARILEKLLQLKKRRAVLVFACSVEHAEILTLALNQAGRKAACVTAQTPRDERLRALEDFQEGQIGFLCNVGVLTTGFDAPRVDVVCITRPTTSALLYEQMVGRGLRGPKNGGTAQCLVMDVQDEGLPDSLMSYERVLHLWE
jgi:superfamily II DNA or RNA helicase